MDENVIEVDNIDVFLEKGKSSLEAVLFIFSLSLRRRLVMKKSFSST